MDMLIVRLWTGLWLTPGPWVHSWVVKRGGGGRGGETQFMQGITAWLFVLCLFSASIVISQRPQNTQELVNETASLTCTASAPPNVDVVYVWKFNNHIINFERDVEYRMVRLCLHLLSHTVALFACHFSARLCKTPYTSVWLLHFVYFCCAMGNFLMDKLHCLPIPNPNVSGFGCLFVVGFWWGVCVWGFCQDIFTAEVNSLMHAHP